MRHRPRIAALLATAVVCAGGCASTMKSTHFENPRFDFNFVERVAVLPFENLTNDRQAGLRATRFAITELLASGAVDVVEPGEVQAALVSLTDTPPGRPPNPSSEQVLSLGKALNAQGLILGSVSQSENLRSGNVPVPVVTIDMRMVETETGATVWAATSSEKGSTLSARLLGTGGEPIAETTRRCVQKVLETLIQ